MINPALIELAGQNLQFFILVVSRFSAALGVLHFFKKGMIPNRIMLIYCCSLAVFTLVNHGLNHALLPLKDQAFYGMVITEIMMGFIIGFIINLYIEIFIAFGQIVSTQSGLGMLSLFVPNVGSVNVLTQFFILSTTLLFFQVNGHLTLISMLVTCIEENWLQQGIHESVLIQIVYFTKIIIEEGFLLSLSMIIALLIANLTLGFMNKFAPQINIMAIGINITLVLCFFILYIQFDTLVDGGKSILNHLVNHAAQMQKKLIP